MLWCCCGVSTLTPINIGAIGQDTGSFTYNPNYYIIGFTNPYPTSGFFYYTQYGPSSSFPGRFDQRGIAVEFPVGAITSTPTSAIFSFLGSSGVIFGTEPAVEPDQDIQYFVFDKSLITISGISITNMGSFVVDSHPASPGWGSGSIILSSDLNSLINDMLTGPSWNPLTSQMVICMLSQNVDSNINAGAAPPDKRYRFVINQELDIT